MTDSSATFCYETAHLRRVCSLTVTINCLKQWTGTISYFQVRFELFQTDLTNLFSFVEVVSLLASSEIISEMKRRVMSTKLEVQVLQSSEEYR